jgi:bifunctional non-homologous end joining protein LigD
MVFDLLGLDGQDFTSAPYSERRAQVEALDLNGVSCQTPQTFYDGPALFHAVCAHELEGSSRNDATAVTGPGERGWVRIKNREYWRYEMERESALNRPRVKQFV